MKHVVSISLGSSIRDKRATINLGDEPILIERIGVDGDEKKARALFKEMDGKVDAFGIGGVELHFPFGGKLYPFRSGHNIVKYVRKTPVVDGGGVKQTVESQIMQFIEPILEEPIQTKRAMMTVGVDRYSMAQSLVSAGYDVVFCDFMFGLGIPIPVYGMKNLLRLGRILLPIVSKLPISLVYPTGKSQETIVVKYERWFAYGPVIAGDFLYIRRYLPEDLAGRLIVTNTTTAADVELLRKRGLKYLATTTPVFAGRSFGTNVLEAALVAYAAKRRTLTTVETFSQLLQTLQIRPTLRKLNR